MNKINELSLNNQTNEFNPDIEKFIKNNQMLLSSTDAWGVLRRDLILTLGVERAKRFLLRYGWHCGKSEAKLFKEMFDWSNNLEWLVAGSKMHNIGGRVFSYPIKFDVDIDNGKFDVAGIWIDSYEAKQHLQHFSFYHEPICYFLVGYAGGYTSACLGKKIIFKETHCVAKGDPQCRYIGKTLEQWGDEIQEDLINYEEQDISDELDRVYRRVEKQKEVLKIGSSISKKLTSALLQGKGLDDFSKILSKELHYPVIIHNQYFDVIAGCYDKEDYDEILEYFKTLESQTRFDQTFQINLPNNRWLLISPIIIKREIYGYISLWNSKKNFEDEEFDFIERAATSCALQILNERTVVETEERMKGELLEELFTNNADVNLISQKLSYLGYNIKASYYVIVFQLNEKTNLDISVTSAQSCQHNQIEKLLNFIKNESERYMCKSLISKKMNRAYALIPLELVEKKQTDINSFITKCKHYIIDEKQLDNNPIYIGISTVSNGIENFNKKFIEANKAIEIAMFKNSRPNINSENKVISAEDLGHLLLFLDARNPDQLLSFAEEKLKVLRSYDEKNDSELMNTLYFYIENECNLHKTARVMNVSISGMRYRIQRIQELANLDLSQSSSRFEIQLSLQVYLVFGLLKIS